MSELALVEQPRQLGRSEFTRDQVELIKRTVAHGATDDELQMFLYQAQRTGLDPLARQIIFQKYNTKDGPRVSIITTIDGYRLTADRTGKYAGNDDYHFNDDLSEFEHIKQHKDGDYPITATATVWKIVRGQRVPFSATARWDEYYPGENKGFMWRKMPYLMLGKCAEALALRKAFPMELSGIYTQDEMAQAADNDNEGFTDIRDIARRSRRKANGNGEPLTLETAAKITTSNGTLLGDLDADQLQWIVDNPDKAGARKVEAANLLIGALMDQEPTDAAQATFDELTAE